MGCQGRRGNQVALACALLVAALAWAAPAAVAGTISVDDVQVAESGNATFTVTRVAELLAPARTVSFETAAGSAVAPGDFAAVSGSLTFGSSLFGGPQSQQVTVDVKSDALDEPDESFRLVVAGAEVTDGEGVATILDDDPAPSLSVSDGGTVAEGAAGAHARFTVRLSTASGRTVSVNYATADAGATAGSDYGARAGTLTLAPGSTQGSIDVAILDDAADEPAEGLELRLSAPVNATLGDALGTATIADDDEPPPPAAVTGANPGVGPPPSGPAVGLPNLTVPLGTTSGSSASKPSLGISSPRLRRPSTVIVTLSCPSQAGRCSGRVTIFSIPNLHSKIKALRRERRLGAVTFSLAGGRARTLERRLGRSDLALLRRTGRMRVRAYVLTQDASGHTGVRSVNGTLIARTAHSSPSRKK
jgi:hypothetical protein